MSCKQATLVADTDAAGRTDAFNPVELLLAALAACIVKGIERVAPMLRFTFRGVEVRLTAERQDVPPRLTGIAYEILVDTDETDRRLDLLHENVRKYGTISNTLAAATPLTGRLARATVPAPAAD
ncbi:OsmC family protein [Roseomonas eburnea]|uniref:OsmC family protein n=2 Tax=Neoroseomonas eburnea TaxID=1346889 RepID=A0A9X9XG22_9PROT|nr:OsmC family protein [Neoroseomonas eburnea]MBR0682658.1 OsmC family protein [Neoroseomonas eburnea]